MATSKVILITGCSSGLGKSMAEHFLEQGHRVIATARNPQTIQYLAEKYPDLALILALDVTNQDSVNETVEKSMEKFERIDVLINNAGYCLVGVAESFSERESRAQMETNFFGAVRMTQAVLPIMRRQKSGHIVQISSVGGITGCPVMSMYSASKFALEGYSESLAIEASMFNVRVTIVEPGAFKTDIFVRGNINVPLPRGMSEYQPLITGTDQAWEYLRNSAPGDPHKAAVAIAQLLEEDIPPLRLALGPDAVQSVRDKAEKLLKDVNEWEHLSVTTNY
jgi:NAD(P)-dependent dehydrogenase (short-subunit alcohol dehydrogenase family)